MADLCSFEYAEARATELAVDRSKVRYADVHYAVEEGPSRSSRGRPYPQRIRPTTSWMPDDEHDGEELLRWHGYSSTAVEHILRAAEHCDIVLVPNPWVEAGRAHPEQCGSIRYYAVNPLDLMVAESPDWRPAETVPEDYYA